MLIKKRAPWRSGGPETPLRQRRFVSAARTRRDGLPGTHLGDRLRDAGAHLLAAGLGGELDGRDGVAGLRLQDTQLAGCPEPTADHGGRDTRESEDLDPAGDAGLLVGVLALLHCVSLRSRRLF